MKSDEELALQLMELQRVRMDASAHEEVWSHISGEIQDASARSTRTGQRGGWKIWLAATVAIAIVGGGLYQFEKRPSASNLGGSPSSVDKIAHLLKAVPRRDLQSVTMILNKFPGMLVPGSLPFVVTGAATSIHSIGMSNPTTQVEIDFLNTLNRDVLTETALTSPGRVGDANQTLTLENGSTAYYSHNASSSSLSWNQHGYFYSLMSDGSSGGKVHTRRELVEIANSMS